MTKAELESLKPGDRVKGPSGFAWTVNRLERKTPRMGAHRTVAHLFVTSSKITPENCGEWSKVEGE